VGTLDGRRVLVTGASSGIGRVTAVALDRAGARVALLARRHEALEQLAGTLTDAAVVPCDVTDPDATTVAVDAAADALSGLDGLVNAAGVAVPANLLDGEPADWRTTFEVNVLGLLHAVRAAVPHLRRNEPADVVNLSSMSGRRRASTQMTAYSASKHAVHVLSGGLREELHPLGVRVTTISPGFVDTPIFDRLDETEDVLHYRDRAAEVGLAPGDVAAQVVHALGLPSDVALPEVAITSLRQFRRPSSGS